MNYKEFTQHMAKQAAAIMTPEAMAAAQQPPMDPAAGGAPMDPAMAGGAPPMDPAMAGGAPAPAPADPAAMGAAPAAAGPNGGQIPPEILQDQQFLAFLAQVAGIQLDPASGTFIDLNGQPVPAEAIVQAYQEFQTQMQAMQQGGAPMDPAMAGGAPPMDPAAGAMPPDAGAMPPTDPAAAGAMPPDAGMPPADPAATGAAPAEPPAVPDDVMNQISTAVMSGVEATLQDFATKLEEKFEALSQKIDKLSEDFNVLTDTDDRRKREDLDDIAKVRDELSDELNPIKQAAKTASASRPLNIFDLINGK